MDTGENEGRNGHVSGRHTPGPKVCRGVRGAITVKNNDADEILAATREMLYAIVQANEMKVEDIASAYFTTTVDLNATYPALAARQMGWFDVPLLCGHEMDVPDGLGRCIRVLIHWNTTRSLKEVAHVYLRDAVSLRPDRKSLPPIRPRQADPIKAMIHVLQHSM